MPKSKLKGLFYDTEILWTCGVCKKALRNKNTRGCNMMKKLHFKANPDCKNKSKPETVKGKLQTFGASVINGSYQEAVNLDKIKTLTNINVENLTVQYEFNQVNY